MSLLLEGGGVHPLHTNSAWKEMYLRGEIGILPPAYFRKVQSIIGKDILDVEERSIVVIWIDDLPVKIIYLEYGEVIETEVIKKIKLKNPWQIIDQAEIEGLIVFDVEF
ncbi:hypothetical protein J7J00_17670 [Bacillus sp. ISL-4]|uniref:hypothetical protein n=1 Tax=Bacillus sp. ISL-4 TaxID=2819125 RepID=UPI001BE7F05A|nr:hypothetical protein [Bacillus sp. ISL-4]MBT2667311.1 hypothetical protein [Bacillus sp. ISL-4]MBT2674187.1 hypothetical protein [Streptomyces sp. ISL-14]